MNRVNLASAAAGKSTGPYPKAKLGHTQKRPLSNSKGITDFNNPSKRANTRGCNLYSLNARGRQLWRPHLGSTSFDAMGAVVLPINQAMLPLAHHAMQSPCAKTGTDQVAKLSNATIETSLDTVASLLRAPWHSPWLPPTANSTRKGTALKFKRDHRF